MYDTNYKTTDKALWQGRVDSLDNFDAFRWHQWVEPIDLMDTSLKTFEDALSFAFIGFCCDEGIRRNKGRVGAAYAPHSIRNKLANLPCCFKQQVKLYDAGNIICENISLEESQALLSEAVEKLLNLNLFPIVLGGGHEVAFGHYNGILKHLLSGKTNPRIGIINFDAHFDLRPYTDGGSSGTMFRQIADICEEKALKYSYLCIGVQKHSNTAALFKSADSLGADYIPAEYLSNGVNDSIYEKLNNFIKEQDYIYVTICSDVFAAPYAPGVSAPQPFGLNPQTVLNLYNYILKSNKVLSFDIAEVSPEFDRDNATAALASTLIFSAVNTLSEINGLSIY